RFARRPAKHVPALRPARSRAGRYDYGPRRRPLRLASPPADHPPALSGVGPAAPAGNEGAGRSVHERSTGRAGERGVVDAPPELALGTAEARQHAGLDVEVDALVARIGVARPAEHAVDVRRPAARESRPVAPHGLTDDAVGGRRGWDRPEDVHDLGPVEPP